MEGLLKHDWLLGGESSGHIICLNAATTGDGIISALLVLTAIVSLGKTLHELKSGMQKFPQKLINVKVSGKINLDLPEIETAKKAAEEKLKAHGRVLLRPSGTEPVVRVMVESDDDVLTAEVSEELAEIIRKTLVH